MPGSGQGMNHVSTINFLIVAHYRNRLDVVGTNDGAVKGSIVTNADDMLR